MRALSRAWIGSLALLVAMAALTGQVAKAQRRRQVTLPGDQVGWVAVGCFNPGTQQDTAKTPRIVNTTGAAIPRGRSLLWRASDGDHGGMTLGKDLIPGESVKGAGKPARIVYSCSAIFHAGAPDLTIVSASFSKTASVVVRNTNAWIDAGRTTARFELLKCADGALLSTEHAGPLAVAAGASQTFVAKTITGLGSKPVKRPPYYWRITLDFDNQLAESNENNNVWSNRSTCSR